MKTNIWFILVPTVICLTAVFASLTLIRELRTVKLSALPKISQVQDFNLSDENGAAFGLKNLHGKVWVADFFFTTCSGICPMMTKRIAELARTFDQIPAVNFVSITVNPENDSPEVLKAYAEKYKHMKERWHFLTGNREEITDLVLKSFKLGSIEEPIFHSPHFTLVDRDGFIRGYYDSNDTRAIAQLFRDINVLLKNKR